MNHERQLRLCEPNKTEEELTKIIMAGCTCEESHPYKHQCELRAGRWTRDLEGRFDSWTDNMRQIAWETARCKNGWLSILVYEGSPIVMDKRVDEQVADSYLAAYEKSAVRKAEIAVMERLGFGATVAGLSLEEAVPAVGELLKGSAIAGHRIQHQTDTQIERHVRKYLQKYVDGY